VPQGQLSHRKIGEFEVPFIPGGVTVTPDDTLIVCGHLEGRVFMFRSNGHKLDELLTPTGTKAADVECVNDYILVADRSTESILVFETNGTYIMSLQESVPGLYGICVQDDKLFATSHAKNKVYMVDWLHGHTRTLFVQHASQVPSERPWFVAANRSRVAVGCWGMASHGHVKVFNMQAQLLYTYTGQRSNFDPAGVLIDSNDTLLVSDWGNHCIDIVSGQGQLRCQIDLEKDGLCNPAGLTINRHLVVTSRHTKKVVTYTFQ
jgi:hypothetical protein